MLDNVRRYLDEAIDLADSCPDKYQAPCFHALVTVLAQTTGRPEESRALAVADRPRPFGNGNSAFISQYEINQDELTRIYHWDGNSYNLIVRDLRVKPTAQRQIRLALLLGAQQLLAGSEPAIAKDRLIDICKRYAAYDASNFASTMKKPRDLFLPRGKDWLLTVPGQEQAAQVIKQLAQ